MIAGAGIKVEVSHPTIHGSLEDSADSFRLGPPPRPCRPVDRIALPVDRGGGGVD